MNNYKVLCECWDKNVVVKESLFDYKGHPSLFDYAPHGSSNFPINSARAATGAVIGGAVGYGIAHIMAKYFNEVKKVILNSNTPEEAYGKFQDIVYNDRLIFTRRKFLQIPVIDRYFEKLVQRKDPQWKEKILKRLRWCKALTVTIPGTVIGAVHGLNAGGNL